MKTTTIIVLVLFFSAVLFLSVFAVKLLAPKTENALNAQTEDQGSNESVQTTSAATTSTLNESGTTSSTVLPEESPQIEKIEIWLDGIREGGGIFLGQADYGLPSPETSALYGENFSDCGYYLKYKNDKYIFEPGSVHNIYIYTYIPKSGWNYIRKTVTVPGEPQNSPSIKFMIDTPLSGATINEDTNIGGWAVNTSSLESPGIAAIEFYINGPKGFGKLLGPATLGGVRQDVAETTGNPGWANSGFNFLISISDYEPATENSVYCYAYSSNQEVAQTILDLKIAGSKNENTTIFAETDFSENILNGSFEIKGWAVSKDLFNVSMAEVVEKEYRTKKIVYTSSVNGNEDIYIMNIDGTEKTQLTDDAGNDQYPQSTPDGRILYTAEIKGVWQLMIMNIDGSGKSQLTSGPNRSAFGTMSFDGKYIFYEVYMENNWELFRINSDGSNRVRLTFNPSSEDWHPFAHTTDFKVLYESGSTGNEEIYYMNFDGGSKTILTDYAIRKRLPTISKDGKYIAFSGYEGNTGSIYLMNSDGSNVVRLTNNGAGYDNHPAISADNAYIAFDGSFSGDNEIYIMNFDGSGLKNISNTPGSDWGANFIYLE